MPADGAAFLRQPVLCYVTDRRRLAALRSEPDEAPSVIEALAGRVREAARAGVRLIQLRDPNLPAGRAYDLVRELLPDVHASGATLVVNDRLDVALAAGADGVHLRESSVAAAAVRRVAPDGLLVGRSVHATEAAAVHGRDPHVDYLVFGTVFPTTSKPALARTAGLAALRAAVSAARCPVLAIGGVRREHFSGLAATGCRGLAASDLFQRADSFAELHEIVAAFRRAFDTVELVS